jgi:hypothetical protein
MNIADKVQLAKQAIHNIVSHHDAHSDEIEAAMDDLSSFMEQEMDDMPEARRRHFERIEAERQRKLAARRDQG